MGFLLESTFAEVTCILSTLCWILYCYATQKHNYWKKKNVPYVRPSFPFGSVQSLMLGKKHVGLVFDDFCQEFKNEPFFGVYEGQRPSLVVKDPDLLKCILTKHFNHFTDRLQTPIDMKKDYLSNNLFNMTGREWKIMRLKWSSTFSSVRMKAMFFLMKKGIEHLKDYVDDEIKKDFEIDIKDTFSRFTMDIIATCAFGLKINSLSEKNCEFYLKISQSFKPYSTIIALFRKLIFIALPFLSKLYVPCLIREDVTKFFTNIVKNSIKYRQENNVKRNDFLDLLIEMHKTKGLFEDKDKASRHSAEKQDISTEISDKELTTKEIASQAFIFFGAGFETSSSTLTFCLYELARNPEIQDKLYQEIREVLAKHEGELSYQAMQDMTYMKQIIDETLRRYASLAILFRFCTETYKMPNSDLILEKGQKIIIPTYSIHHNPKYFPDPYKFDPERFAPERVQERHPYVHLPFGEGPRMCIGKRFGILLTKVGLAEMVFNFHFEISPKIQVPVALHKTSFNTMPEKPIMLHLTKRKT